MIYFVTKTLLALLLVAAGVAAALSMLTLMGRAEHRVSAAALKKTHRITGYTFIALLAVLAVMGLHYLSAAGDALSMRGVLHWASASLLVFVVLLKLAVVRWFRQFTKLAPVMGMIVTVLALLVAALSAGFFLTTGGSGVVDLSSLGQVTEERDAESEAIEVDAVLTNRTNTVLAGDVARGELVFGKYCHSCHHADSIETKIGPGLAGLFDREVIASSGLSVTPENVREQILSPTGGMPSFRAYLSDGQLDDLIVYLQTL